MKDLLSKVEMDNDGNINYDGMYYRYRQDWMYM